MKYLLATMAVLTILTVANAADYKKPITLEEYEDFSFELGYVAMNCKPDNKDDLLKYANEGLEGVSAKTIHLKMLNKEREVENAGGLEVWCEKAKKTYTKTK